MHSGLDVSMGTISVIGIVIAFGIVGCNDGVGPEFGLAPEIKQYYSYSEL